MKKVAEVKIKNNRCLVYLPDDINAWKNSRKKAGHNDICSITGEKLSDDGFYLFINNYSLFPNCFANKEAVDKMGFEKAVKHLAKDYKNAQKYKHWFV